MVARPFYQTTVWYISYIFSLFGVACMSQCQCTLKKLGGGGGDHFVDFEFYINFWLNSRIIFKHYFYFKIYEKIIYKTPPPPSAHLRQWIMIWWDGEGGGSEGGGREEGGRLPTLTVGPPSPLPHHTSIEPTWRWRRWDQYNSSSTSFFSPQQWLPQPQQQQLQMR